MPWNWQLPHWPQFKYHSESINHLERSFLLELGNAFASIKNISNHDHYQYIVEILSLEGLESSKIEGEILDRESLQSSIQKQFGLHVNRKTTSYKEIGMAEVLCDVYKTFDAPLTHEMLWKWHDLLFRHSPQIDDKGKYRTHAEPMQIISGQYGAPKIYFEAPPSAKVHDEMTKFIEWYNASSKSESILGRTAIAHVYFESIHPFEDGNGRIGRVLIEKMFSQCVGHPVLIAISKVLEKRRKEYYIALEKCNKSLNASEWVEYFAEVTLQAQQDSMNLLNFLINKSKMFLSLSGQINSRQEKALLRMFAEGPSGFKGGLSAENYIKITKASRATATRDLMDLVQKGALVKTGELKHTRYWLNLQHP